MERTLKRSSRGWLPTALLLAALALPAGRSAATSTLDFAVKAEGSNSAAVSSGGRAVVRVRTDNGKAAEFAAVIAKRLRALAEAGLEPGAISVKPASDGFAVYGGGTLICTATKEAAAAANTDAAALAESWAKNLREAFGRPYLTVPWDTVLVPLGESMLVPVGGNGPRFTATTTFDIADAAVAADGRGVMLAGRALGKGRLILRRDGAELGVDFEVKQRAGTVTGPITATVTGLGVDEADVREAVRSELHGNVVVRPGAWMKFALPQRVELPRTPGQSTRVPVSVRVDGGDYLPFASDVPVTVVNAAWPDQRASRLLVSNEPESVDRQQLLLRGTLPVGERTRLLYHHKTIAPGPLTYEIRILNPRTEPARLHIRDAMSGPHPDEIYVGHQAAMSYWTQRLNGRGHMIHIPPGTAWTIMGAATPSQQVLSGITELTPLEGAELEVEMVAIHGEPLLGARRIAGPTRAPLFDRFLFPTPYKDLEAVYRPGGMYAFLSVGREPVQSVQATPLPGNYGVVYDIVVGFENTDAKDGRYELVLSADGGVGRGVVVINGKTHETGLLRPMAQERLLDVALPPGGRSQYKLRLMPQSGSNYPMRLVGRPYTRGWAGKGPLP